MKPSTPHTLPPAILEAWQPDSPQWLGGLMELAGLDPEWEFRMRRITDHPWLGLRIRFPFVEVGIGQITRCLIHPRGKLTFDVEFPSPVPYVWHDGPAGARIDPSLPTAIQRFWGTELLAMKVEVVAEERPASRTKNPRRTTDGYPNRRTSPARQVREARWHDPDPPGVP